MDAESGKYLEGENPDEQLPMASTTKMMAVLVALEDGVDLNQEVVVRRRPPPTRGPRIAMWDSIRTIRSA